jgi:hypothetical protein
MDDLDREIRSSNRSSKPRLPPKLQSPGDHSRIIARLRLVLAACPGMPDDPRDGYRTEAESG